MHGNTTHWPTIPSTVDGSDLSMLTPTAGQLKQRRPRERKGKGKKQGKIDLTVKTCRKKNGDRKGERKERNLLYAVLLATNVSIKLSLVLATATETQTSVPV